MPYSAKAPGFSFCLVAGFPEKYDVLVTDLPVFARADPGKTDGSAGLVDRDHIKQDHGFVVPVPFPVRHARCTV